MSKSVQRGRKAPTRASAANKAATTRSARVDKKEAEKTSTSRALTKEKQAGLYDKAMKLFSAGDFAKAREGLEKVIEGPSLEMSHAARMHFTVCERRLASTELHLETANDHYEYAVTLINRRRLETARDHLREALEKLGDGDGGHVHYALALCHGLLGDVDAAATHLSRAIAIDRRNRAAARNDPDFEPFSSAPQIRALLSVGKVETA